MPLTEVTIVTTRLLSTFLGFALLVPALANSVATAAEEKAKTKDTVFELKEVSVFDNGVASQSLRRPTLAQCSTEPFKEVKAYPKLNSKRPLYGKLQFSCATPGKEEAPIYFVLDESGESPAVEEKKDESAEKEDQKAGEAKKQARLAPPLRSL